MQTQFESLFIKKLNNSLYDCYVFYRGNKSMFGLFFSTSKKAAVFAVDTVRTNQMPNLNAMYAAERTAK